MRRLSIAAFFVCAIFGTAASGAAAAELPTPGALYRDGPRAASCWAVPGTCGPIRPTRDGRPAGSARAPSAAGCESRCPTPPTPVTSPSRATWGSVYWYRKDFNVPSVPHGSRWILRFESVNYRATVWINGKPIGSHAGAYLPFELEAAHLKKRGTNHLVVRVDSRRGPLDVPSLALRRDGRYTGGWWNYAGILREVYLRQVKRFDFQDVLVRPHLRCRHCDATIDVTATVANVGGQPALATARGGCSAKALGLRAGGGRGRQARRFKAQLARQPTSLEPR